MKYKVAFVRTKFQRAVVEVETDDPEQAVPLALKPVLKESDGEFNWDALPWGEWSSPTRATFEFVLSEDLSIPADDIKEYYEKVLELRGE